MKRVKFIQPHAAYGYLRGDEASLNDPVAEMLVRNSYAEYLPERKARKTRTKKDDKK